MTVTTLVAARRSALPGSRNGSEGFNEGAGVSAEAERERATWRPFDCAMMAGGARHRACVAPVFGRSEGGLSSSCLKAIVLVAEAPVGLDP